jgi:hypothetical protein
VFAKGYGSVNVRVGLDIGQRALDNFPVSEKPMIRVNMAKLEQFTAEQSGVTYTNLTSFVDVEQAVDNQNQPMQPKISGRIGGEITNFQNLGNVLKFTVISYSLDKNGNLVISRTTGQPIDPAVIKVEVHNPEIIQSSLAAGLGNGANAEVGYYYYNKQDVTYDDFGMTVGNPNNKIERVEAGRIDVHRAAPNNTQQQQGFGGQPQNQQFGGQPQGMSNINNQMPTGMGQQAPQGNGFGQQPNLQKDQFNQQQSNPFGQQQQQVNQQPVNQQQGQNPFGGHPDAANQGQQQQMGQNPFTGQQQPVQQQGNGMTPYDFMNVDTSQAAPFEQGFNQQQQGQQQGQFGQQANQFFGGQQGGNPFQQ